MDITSNNTSSSTTTTAAAMNSNSNNNNNNKLKRRGKKQINMYNDNEEKDDYFYENNNDESDDVDYNDSNNDDNNDVNNNNDDNNNNNTLDENNNDDDGEDIDCDADIDDDEEDEDDDDDASEGSFPTTKDLASLSAAGGANAAAAGSNSGGAGGMNSSSSSNSNSSSRPPESVSYLGIGIGLGLGLGGLGIKVCASSGGGSIGGGGSVGGISETKSMTGQRSLSFCSDIERASTTGGFGGSSGIGGGGGTSMSGGGGGVMITHSSIRLCHEPVVPYFAPFETAKSDIATVCSNSVMEVEDIASDAASVGTIHSATTSANYIMQQHSNLSNNNNNNNNNSASASASANTCADTNRKKKHDRRLEFATETVTTSTVWKYNSAQYSMPMRSSPTQQHNSSTSTSAAVTQSYHVLNDMGPPLNRSLLEKVRDVVGVGPTSSTGTPSRAGSVKSFGSQAASEVVHVDTDDCGGSIVDFSGLDENPSFQSMDNVSVGKNQQEVRAPTDEGGMIGVLANGGVDASNHYQSDHGESGDKLVNDCTQNQVVSLHTLHECYRNGRVSPGGTVYKGRGVRKYQSAYMHLPLKRFQENGATLPEPMCHDGHDSKQPENSEWQSHRSWQGKRSRSHSRSRSRSRSRDRDTKQETGRWNRSNSKSPSSRSVNNNRNNEGWERDFRGYHNNGRSGNGGRWKQNRRNNNEGSNNQRYKNSSGSRRGGWHGSNNSNNWGRHKMTPRDPRHRDIKK
jgi:hypothetical protein